VVGINLPLPNPPRTRGGSPYPHDSASKNGLHSLYQVTQPCEGELFLKLTIYLHCLVWCYLQAEIKTETDEKFGCYSAAMASSSSFQLGSSSWAQMTVKAG